jgi:ATP-dependent DNA ligase
VVRGRNGRVLAAAGGVPLLYLGHLAERGSDLFRVACERDLGGAKWARGTYQTDGRGTPWLKIKNAWYSQREGRRELFEDRRGHRRPRRARTRLELQLR